MNPNHSKFSLKNFILTRKKKIMLIVAGLFIFSVSCSVTSTLAWYAINKSFTVRNLNVVIGSEQETLRLGIRDANGEVVFKDEYTNEDLDISHDGLLPVSAMRSEEWLNNTSILDSEKMPEFREAYWGPTTQITNYATEGFVRKEFFLKSSRDCSLYLSDETFAKPNEAKNRITADTYTDISYEHLNDAINSLRMSFYVDSNNSYTIVNPGNSLTTYYGGLLDLNLDGYYDIDHTNNAEFAYGEVNGGVSYLDYTYSDSTPYPNSTSTFIANHPNNVKLVDLSKTSFKKENSRKLSEVCINEEVGQTSNAPLCILHKDVVQRIVVSLYLEGWDEHTVDHIQRAAMDVSILFMALYNL